MLKDSFNCMCFIGQFARTNFLMQQLDLDYKGSLTQWKNMVFGVRYEFRFLVSCVLDLWRWSVNIFEPQQNGDNSIQVIQQWSED